MIGYHIRSPILESFIEAEALIADYGLRPVVQFFVVGPQNHLLANISAADKEYISAARMPHVIHSAYVSNPWNKAAGAVHNLKIELRISEQMGSLGVILHLGAGAHDDDILKYVFGKIGDIGTTLWLEINSAKMNTFASPADIRALFAKIRGFKMKLRVGLCIDTAHLYACGVSLSSYAFTKQYLADLPKIPIGFHLNDAENELGSGHDIHCPILAGNIWKKYDKRLPIKQSGLMAILEFAEHHNSFCILERNKGEDVAVEFEIVRKLGYLLARH